MNECSNDSTENLHVHDRLVAVSSKLIEHSIYHSFLQLFIELAFENVEGNLTTLRHRKAQVKPVKVVEHPMHGFDKEGIVVPCLYEGLQ